MGPEDNFIYFNVFRLWLVTWDLMLNFQHHIGTQKVSGFGFEGQESSVSSVGKAFAMYTWDLSSNPQHPQQHVYGLLTVLEWDGRQRAGNPWKVTASYPAIPSSEERAILSQTKWKGEEPTFRVILWLLACALAGMCFSTHVYSHMHTHTPHIPCSKSLFLLSFTNHNTPWSTPISQNGSQLPQHPLPQPGHDAVHTHALLLLWVDLVPSGLCLFCTALTEVVYLSALAINSMLARSLR